MKVELECPAVGDCALARPARGRAAGALLAECPPCTRSATATGLKPSRARVGIFNNLKFWNLYTTTRKTRRRRRQRPP